MSSVTFAKRTARVGEAGLRLAEPVAGGRAVHPLRVPTRVVTSPQMRSPTHQRTALAVVAAAGLAAGCFPVAQPRLPQDVGAALAERPMRRLETADMFLYYPEGRNIEAWRFATRVEGCVASLRHVAHVHNGVADQKIVAILPELAFNNAFVLPRAFGYETLAVVPTYNTLDAFALESGLPPDPA